MVPTNDVAKNLEIRSVGAKTQDTIAWKVLGVAHLRHVYIQHEAH